MRKISLLMICCLLSVFVSKAQYSGGNGSGIVAVGISARHLTNWFQTNGNWSNAGNWADGMVPVSSEEANIAAEATLDGDYTYPVVNISASGKLIVPAGNTLTVDDELMNSNGTTGLMLLNGSSLIHPNPDVPGTMLRQVTDADWSNGMDGWHLLSSPVEHQSLLNGDFTTGSYDFYAWSETGNNWLNQKTGANNINAFIPGNGYLVSYDDGGTKTFAGELNVSAISLSNLSKSGSSLYNGYHLLGNPFASALKWNDGNWNLNNISGVASVWNETAQNYLSLANPDEIIPANLGFFVQATDAANSITIPATARTHNLTPLYKDIPADFLKFKVSHPGGSTYDETIIRFKEGASSFYDPAYDSHKMTGSDTAPQLFTLIQPGERVAVNTMNLAEVPPAVAMGFRPGAQDTYSLKAELFTFSRPVVLEDRFTGSTMTISSGAAYSFYGIPGDDENRFVLHFSPVGLPDHADHPDVMVYRSGQVVYIKNSGTTAADIKIFSISGQVLYQALSAPGTLHPVNARSLSPGVFMVQITSEGKLFRQKIVLP